MNRTRLVLVLLLVASLGAAQSTAGGAAEIERYTTYKMGLVAHEGLLVAIVLTILPFAILWLLVKLLPLWPETEAVCPPDIRPVH